VDLSDRPHIPSVIGIFTIEEAMSGRPGSRVFQAKTPTGDACTLMAYDLGKDPLAAQELQAFYMREYTTLQKLRDTALVQEVGTPFPWSDDFLIVPILPLSGKSLSAYPPPETRDDLLHELALLEASFKGLATIHEHNVLHRALGPDTIHVTRPGQKPQIAFTHFFAARMGETSIAASLDELKLDDPYAAPALAGGYGLATPATDLFSLALVFLARLSGVAIGEVRTALQQEHSLPDLQQRWSSLPEALTTELERLFQSILRPAAGASPPSAAAIAQRIGELARQLHVDVTVETAQLLDDRYKVLRILGQGTMARTLLAMDTEYDLLVALKQFFRPSEVYDQVRAEFLALQPLRSKHLPRINETYPADHAFHIKMEYIPGPTLHDVAAEFPWSLDRWWQLAQDLLNAIEELEAHGLLHRDLKPANIILHEQDGRAVVIDFGFAVNQGTLRQAAGSPLYLPPEALSTPQPPASSDRYAAGVVLFKVLTGHLPFVTSDDRIDRTHLRTPETADARIQRLAAVLLRAVDPDPQNRPASVAEIRHALQNAMLDSGPEPGPDLPEQVNAWVDNLRGLYRNSKTGNADNRGLDSQFVRDTYVSTALDTVLLPGLFMHHPKAVFLCGNPGDGKTAFLEQVQAALQQRGATRHTQDASGWEWHHNGHIFRSCYDASESHEGQSADEQLTAKLHDLQGSTPPASAVTVLVAINDGRMADYFARYQQPFTWLARQVEAARGATTLEESPVWVVDLKRRAFVSLPDANQPSVLQRVLESLIAPDQWQVCLSCAAQTSCPIYANAQALRDPAVRDRLEYLLLLAHLRQQRHITMRDLRSALAYLITGNTSCTDIHKIRQGSEAGATFINLAYWRSAFDALDQSDDMLTDMAPLDPARFPQPRLDRFFHFHQALSDAPLRSTLFAHRQDMPPQRFPTLREWIAAMKRRLYFEAAAALEQGDQAPTTAMLPQVSWQALLPYQHATTFLAVLGGKVAVQPVLRKLALGILRSDGTMAQTSPDYLSIKVAASDEQQLIVLKQIPLVQFRLTSTHTTGDEVLETIPETLILEHVSGTPWLPITLDLFELLMRMAEGLRSSAPELQPLLEDLMPFKSALLLQSTHELVVLESQRRTHHIVQQAGRIIRQVP
jgi:serine/threonine protein kinase